MAGGVPKTMTFEEAWPILQEAINKLTHGFESEGDPNRQLYTSNDYMRLYTVCYNTCSPNPIGPEAQKLYDQYQKTFEDYISSQILPTLRGKEDENLLRELLRRWNNHKIMVRWLSRFFHYLERHFIIKKNLPSLVEVSYLAFYNLVYGEFHDQIRDAIVSLIDREREGYKIDSTLITEIVDIYTQLSELIGKGMVEHNTKDMEEAMIKSITTFYSRNASNWIASMSREDYMHKVEICLEQEKARASDYIKFGSKNKVLEVVKHELLTVCANQPTR